MSGQHAGAGPVATRPRPGEDLVALYARARGLAEGPLGALVDLAVRLALAQGFFVSGLLKVADSFRDLSFEIRQARAALEHQTARLEHIHQEWWAWNQRELADRAEESRRREKPTLEEIMEDVG